jgi:two-component system, OmpR family, alkaline phosphatase synthesis response regulator PhoP
MASKKILVIDDDVQFVDTLVELLSAAGYEVQFAYTPQAGREMATAQQPDLIILDVMFACHGGLDGFDVARTLHSDEKTRRIPVIIISGVRKVLDLPFRMEPDDTWMPVKSYIEKPVKPDRLLKEIGAALAEHGN